jgi:PAS domain S-box-containing protein
METFDGHRRLLLVEDEAIIALSERHMLEAHGYDVVVVHSGESAVQRAREDPDVALVLMDIDLGSGMDGTKAARAILEERELPVVFLTNHAEREMVDLVKDITCYGYVLKSAGEFVLVESIEMAFKLFDTHRRLARENAEHRRTRAFLESTLEAIQDGISVLDLDLKVRHVNSVMNRWYRDKVPLEGRACYEVYHDRATVCPDCPTVRAIASGRTECSVLPGPLGSGVTSVELFAYPMRDPETGELSGIVEFVRDISRREEADRKLRELRRRSEERRLYLEAILSAAPDAVLTLDRDHLVREWNPGAERLFGFSAEEARGRDIDTLVAGTGADDYNAAHEITARVARHEVVPPTEAVRYRKDGSPVDVLFSGAPIVIDGDLIGVVAIYKDMSALRRAERETARSEENFRLLFHESQHRIKNDLALVRALLSMQAEATPDAACRDVLEEAESRVTVIATVHEELFRHSEVETVQVSDFIESLVSGLRRVWEPANVEITVQAEDLTVPSRVSLSLGIILNELLTNALKHGLGPGHPGRIRAKVFARGNRHIVLSLADSGGGFPEEVLSGDRPGLGLSIISALAAQHDGALELRNEGGAVSEVIFALPPPGGENHQ